MLAKLSFSVYEFNRIAPTIIGAIVMFFILYYIETTNLKFIKDEFPLYYSF